MNFKQAMFLAGEKNRFERTPAFYFIIYTSVMYFTSVLMVAALKTLILSNTRSHVLSLNVSFLGLLNQSLVNLKGKSTPELWRCIEHIEHWINSVAVWPHCKLQLPG